MKNKRLRHELIWKVFTDCNIRLGRNWNKRMNRVLHNDGSETLKHFIVKSIICKLIREQKRDYVSEVEIGTGVADILDITLRTVYDIETNPTDTIYDEKVKKYNVGDNLDVYIVDTNKLPDDINEIRDMIYKEYFEMFA